MRYESAARRTAGFTLIELMITLVVLGVLAAIALVSYNAYVQRGQLTQAFDALGAYRVRMEQSYLDNGNYGVAACSVPLPPATAQFTYTCALTGGGQTFTATATGAGITSAYAFTINATGTQVTTAFPGASVPANCWLTRQGGC